VPDPSSTTVLFGLISLLVTNALAFLGVLESVDGVNPLFKGLGLIANIFCSYWLAGKMLDILKSQMSGRRPRSR